MLLPGGRWPLYPSAGCSCPAAVGRSTLLPDASTRRPLAALPRYFVILPGGRWPLYPLASNFPKTCPEGICMTYSGRIRRGFLPTTATRCLPRCTGGPGAFERGGKAPALELLPICVFLQLKLQKSTNTPQCGRGGGTCINMQGCV